MTSTRLGAVGYLNARPLVYGLERLPRFDIRYDVPAECARLLHEGVVDVGLIPSIEYLRGGPYRMVPGLAIASRGSVASVALYTTRAIEDVRSISMDTSSRTSVALVRVLCARLYKIRPVIDARGPDLTDMLVHSDAALIIGDNALFLDHTAVRPPVRPVGEGSLDAAGRRRSAEGGELPGIEKIDLGDAWMAMTGLPFVYACWVGRPEAMTSGGIDALQQACRTGLANIDAIARDYFPASSEKQAIGAAYLRDNIKYHLGDEERAGLELFFRYAAETGVVPTADAPRFY
jgi:chorismate dehydratase